MLRCAKTHVHAQFGAHHQQRIAHIVAGVAHIGVGKLMQGLGAMFAHGEHIGQHLRGVEFIGEAVEHRHAGIGRQFFHHRLTVAAVFDAVIHAPQHAGGVFHAFFVANLAA